MEPHVITLRNIQTDSVGETSAVDPNTALVGACICQCKLGDADLEALFLPVVSDGGSAFVAWSSVATGGGNS